MRPHEIATALHNGEINANQAADELRAWLAEQGCTEKPMFDQQERRLLMGYPIVENEELQGGDK